MTRSGWTDACLQFAMPARSIQSVTRGFLIPVRRDKKKQLYEPLGAMARAGVRLDSREAPQLREPRGPPLPAASPRVLPPSLRLGLPGLLLPRISASQKIVFSIFYSSAALAKETKCQRGGGAGGRR